MGYGYCIDVYTDKEPSWAGGCSMAKKSHPSYGIYWQIRDVEGSQKRRIIRKIKRRGIRYRIYESRWERSGNYRKAFFNAYAPPYRCRYCNKRVKEGNMQIDHIVPVAKAKKSTNARMLLYIQGIPDVNDVRNLAPSCSKCNNRKSDKMGIWWVKGMLGRHKAYWAFRKILFCAAFLFLCLYIYHIFPR